MKTLMFVILQKYDFSSKSQLWNRVLSSWYGCLWYCKSTIFQANHNNTGQLLSVRIDVCDTAKVRFFKQITTLKNNLKMRRLMFVILQKYDFSSKSQRTLAFAYKPLDVCDTAKVRFFKQITTCVKYPLRAAWMFVILQKYDFSSKSQPSHRECTARWDVCDTAKVRFFKQITTMRAGKTYAEQMFVILQKYDFSSKSQPLSRHPILW